MKVKANPVQYHWENKTTGKRFLIWKYPTSFHFSLSCGINNTKHFLQGVYKTKPTGFFNGEHTETITKDVNYPLKITDCITKATIFTITRNWSFWIYFVWLNDGFKGSFEHNEFHFIFTRFSHANNLKLSRALVFRYANRASFCC